MHNSERLPLLFPPSVLTDNPRSLSVTRETPLGQVMVALDDEVSVLPRETEEEEEAVRRVGEWPRPPCLVVTVATAEEEAGRNMTVSGIM